MEMELRKISPEELQEILRKHQLWLDGEDGGERANLERANLEGAYLDYSCLPLWCGSLNAHFDDRQLRQIAYHLVKAGLQSTNASKETKAELAKLIDFANRFHRVKECGEIKLDA
jgi:uncharacterized protein YjbI with pentapeptide repeats